MSIIIDHSIDLDFVSPGDTPRIHVKQGNVFSHRVTLNLYADGEAWLIPADITFLIRYQVHDPDDQADVQGVYDTMPSGESACIYQMNTVTFMPVPHMFSKHGIVSTELVLLHENRILSTFPFEFYVNRSAVAELNPEVHSYYALASLEDINGMCRELEYRVYELEHTVSLLENRISG